jgi:hypothetical protein
MPTWLIQIIVLLIIQAIIYLLTPKPKTPKPPAAQTMDDPTADWDKPMAVVFGTVIQRDPNVLWFGDKAIVSKKIKV